MKKKILIAFLVIILLFISVEIIGIIVLNTEVTEEKNSKDFLENISWKLTQYGGNYMPQRMCFVIEGNNNGLLIIDGGYEDSPDDVERILSIINNHENKVDAWIITHLDSDHAGVILNIIKNHPEIQIDNIYTTNVPTLEKAIEKFPEETEWEQFKDFTAMENDNIHYLYEEDEVKSIIGLKMKVLYAYSDWTYENVKNMLNNGSLFFKLYGKEDSMLFMGDCQDPKVEKRIVQKHKKDLKSTYIQIGHHGNNNFSRDFYKTVSPEIAFFPAPTELIENAYNVPWYTAGKIRDWLVEDGAQVMCLETAPNEITIY